ncbi:hypothetical protein PVIIG_05884 [Plasmodium vivax India VII]|uniref:Uncharacterized protein n=1 Tax=Plasmodium vivax India VII TaxID=1077284 RepID=A0A0J9S390_PLAVI|nr:hypothetical protein PVIIG_05884 [Plasmodium vivax India VII]
MKYNFESLFKDIHSILLSDSEKQYEKCTNVYTKVKAQYDVIDESFITHCNKYSEYLKYIEDNYDGNINNMAKGIIYLYCWLYDKELHKDKYHNNRINIYKKLLEEYDVIEYASNIPNIFRTYLNENIEENLKNLYDLYYKFDKFRKDKKCSDDNCKCAEECYISYNKYIKDCNKPNNADFCNGLEEFRAQYNNYTSNDFKCKEDYKYLPPAINFDISLILIPIIATLIISSLLFVLYKVIILYIYVNIRYLH